MKVRTSTKTLATAVTQASKAVSSRATLPVLSGVRLTANGTLEVAATDLEQTVVATIKCNTDQDGSVIVPSKAFGALLKTIKDSEVALSTDGDEMTVTSGRRTTRIRTLQSDDYPKLPMEQGTREVLAQVSVSAAPLREQLERVVYAASGDESRQVLTGVHFDVGEKGVNMVATDSYRLALTPLDAEFTGEWKGTVPARCINTLIKTGLTKKAGDVRMFFLEGGLLVVVVGHLYFSIRAIDGEFPRYRQLLPEGYPYVATFEADDMIASVQSIGLMAQNNLPVKLHLTPDECEVSAHTPDVGEATDLIPISYNGEPLVVAFNPEFLIDICKAAGPTVTMEVADGLKPALFKGTNTTGLLMPVRLS